MDLKKHARHIDLNKARQTRRFKKTRQIYRLEKKNWWIFFRHGPSTARPVYLVGHVVPGSWILMGLYLPAQPLTIFSHVRSFEEFLIAFEELFVLLFLRLQQVLVRGASELSMNQKTIGIRLLISTMKKSTLNQCCVSDYHIRLIKFRPYHLR